MKKSVSIRKQFIIVQAILFVLLVCIGITSIVKAQQASASCDRVVEEILPGIDHLGDVQAIFKEYRITAIKLPTAQGKDFDDLVNQYENNRQLMRKNLDVLKVVLNQEQITGFEKIIQAYSHQVINVLIPEVKQGKIANAILLIKEQLVPLGNQFDDHTAKMTAYLEQVSHQDAEQLKSDISPVTTNVVLLLVIILSASFFYKLANSITTRVEKLGKEADLISRGILTKKVDHLGTDEIGKLGQDVNSIVTNLSSIVTDMKSDSDTLSTATGEVNTITNTINDKSNQVLDKVITISSAAEEMVATSLEIASNCSLAATSSEEAKKVAVEGMNVVVNTVDEIKNHAVKTREDANLILELGNKTQQINSIISTIQDIASQTNLLALNAAIEAARAGEYGKGFAVVADEVRALAVRSADATKEINTMITSVIEDVQKSNDSIIDTVNKMDAIAQNAGQLQNTLDVITQKVGDVNLEITQIATATEQQTGTSKEMSTHLQQIKSNTQDVTENIGQAKATMDKFIDISEKMHETVNKFTI